MDQIAVMNSEEIRVRVDKVILIRTTQKQKIVPVSPLRNPSDGVVSNGCRGHYRTEIHPNQVIMNDLWANSVWVKTEDYARRFMA